MFEKQENFVMSLIPSRVGSIDQLQKFIRWDLRLSYFYALFLFAMIKIVIYVSPNHEIPINIVGLLTMLFMIQAAMLMYALQVYRRFFILSPVLKKKVGLQLAFSIWLIAFFLFSIDQILGVPIFFGWPLFFIAPNEEGFIDPQIQFWFFLISSVILATTGEYLLKKIKNI